MKSVRGFTLVELMVAVTIFAIIGLVAAPSFNNMLLKQDLNASTRTLTDMLSNARSKAALERRDITVKLNSDAVGNDSTLVWKPTNRSKFVSKLTSITFRLDGVVETNDSLKQPIPRDIELQICDNKSNNSRKVIINRFGLVQDSGLLEGCK